MTTADKPIITDPEALREHLVRLAMEAWDRSAFVGVTGAERRVAFEGYLRERMSQAAQTIVTEIEVAREEAAQWHRKAQQTDDVRLREALQERETMQREVREVLARMYDAEAALLTKRAADDRAVSTASGDAWAVRAAFLDNEATRLRARAAEERGR